MLQNKEQKHGPKSTTTKPFLFDGKFINATSHYCHIIYKQVSMDHTMSCVLKAVI